MIVCKILLIPTFILRMPFAGHNLRFCFSTLPANQAVFTCIVGIVFFNNCCAISLHCNAKWTYIDITLGFDFPMMGFEVGKTNESCHKKNDDEGNQNEEFDENDGEHS